MVTWDDDQATIHDDDDPAPAWPRRRDSDPYAGYRRLACAVVHQAVMDARNRGQSDAHMFLTRGRESGTFKLWAAWIDLDLEAVAESKRLTSPYWRRHRRRAWPAG